MQLAIHQRTAVVHFSFISLQIPAEVRMFLHHRNKTSPRAYPHCAMEWLRVNDFDLNSTEIQNAHLLHG